jgi:hypothetical protein
MVVVCYEFLNFVSKWRYGPAAARQGLRVEMARDGLGLSAKFAGVAGCSVPRCGACPARPACHFAGLRLGNVIHNLTDQAGRSFKSPLELLPRQWFSTTRFIRRRRHSMISDGLASRRINAIRCKAGCHVE